MTAHYDVVVIGGGPAGLAAAIAAWENGAGQILVLERACELGGILNQCIHCGFGLHTFHQELSGPEYAARFVERVSALPITCKCGTMVLELHPDRSVTYLNSQEGTVTVFAKAIVLAMGCRERPRGALNIPGTRPAGIYSAGTAQRLVNRAGLMPGRDVVVLGSGDIGLIMARRMTLEGARVHAVAEVMPYSGGLKRNLVQCLEDFGIPLLLSHTVSEIRGRDRVESVVISQVDEHRQIVPGTDREIPCDTLLLSVGLLPENELSLQSGIAISPVTNGPLVNDRMETSQPGVFACGNVLHVHDLVDFVSQEAAVAGKNAARYACSPWKPDDSPIPVTPASGVRYVVPQTIRREGFTETELKFRVDNLYSNALLEVLVGDVPVLRRRRQILAPGEMEHVTLTRQMLELGAPGEGITVKLGEAAQCKFKT